MTSVSQATRPVGSSRRTASRMASEIWSAILSGCPSVTDSEVKKWRPFWSMESTPCESERSVVETAKPSIPENGASKQCVEDEDVTAVGAPSDRLQPGQRSRVLVVVALEHEDPLGLEQPRRAREPGRRRLEPVRRVGEDDVEELAAARELLDGVGRVAGDEPDRDGVVSEPVERPPDVRARPARRARPTRAPRDTASSPTAPLPAKRSSTRAPGTRSPSRSKSASRARPDVGRASAGASSRLPFHRPAVIRTSGRGRDASVSRPARVPHGAGSGGANRNRSSSMLARTASTAPSRRRSRRSPCPSGGG